MRLVHVAVAAIGIFGCAGEPVGRASAPVVYGEDGRTEVYAHPSAALRQVAQSAVAMKIDVDLLDESDPARVVVDYSRTLGEAKSLCAGERFLDQLEPGTCSGTLIDERFLLTAGHCMDAPSDCSGSAWIFGWRYVAEGELAALDEDDVYRCARVLAYFDDGDVDHAIVELDRAVVGRTPATVRVEASGLAEGTPLALIGHPNGIPMKIDSGGVVTWNDPAATYLAATLDAFNGNSGSGVFDHDGLLVALLRGGEDDYVDAGGCNVVNVIDPPPVDDGESLTYVRPAIEALCAVPGVSSTLCACDGPCVPAPEGDTCAAPTELAAVDQTVSATLVGFAPDARGTCGGAGPDRVYRFTIDRPATLTAQTSGFDTVLYLRDACEGAELACDDDIDRDTDRGSLIETALAPGSYHLFVDAYDADVDAFTLTLAFTAPEPDAGVVLVDADARDASVGPGDAGITPPSDGCTCRASARSDGGAAWLALATLALAVIRRRRVRCASRS